MVIFSGWCEWDPILLGPFSKENAYPGCSFAHHDTHSPVLVDGLKNGWIGFRVLVGLSLSFLVGYFLGGQQNGWLVDGVFLGGVGSGRQENGTGKSTHFQGKQYESSKMVHSPSLCPWELCE